MTVFDWHDWIDLAENLLTQDGAAEAHRRCAVSRAYYAVFNLNHSRLLGAGRIDANPESAHFAVWRELSVNGNAAEKRLANGAKRLKDARTDADYDAAVRHAHEDALYWVSLARRLVEETDALS